MTLFTDTQFALDETEHHHAYPKILDCIRLGPRSTRYLLKIAIISEIQYCLNSSPRKDGATHYLPFCIRDSADGFTRQHISI